MPVREVRVSLWRRDWFWGLLLIVFVFVAYAQVFRADFIWDDESHLTQNACVIGPLGLREIWTTARAVYYPLVLSTFWTLHKFFGLNPFPYHLLNVLLHAASAVLLWRILRLLQIRGAWLGAALWALHPVMVQSVAWITELKNTQSCLFYLLSILCFLKWQNRSEGSAISGFQVERSTGSFSFKGFILSLVFFILATLSKPSVVMLPFVLALCIWWMRGKIRWHDMLTLTPFALISALASAWTIWEQKFHSHAIGPDWSQTFSERLIIASKAMWFYLGKLAWPHPLIFIYPRWSLDSSSVVAYLPLLAALAVLVALLLIQAKRSRALFFAAAYYFASLFPVLGIFTVFFFRYSFVSDHFQYLASMGPLALAGAGIAVLVQRFCVAPSKLAAGTDALQFPGNNIAVARSKMLSGCALCSVLLLILIFLTWRQTAEYRDLVTLYTATLENNPTCWLAHNNLGIVLLQRGRTSEALDHYEQALRINPDYAEAHNNLGNVLLRTGRTLEAIDQYKQALRINPNIAMLHSNLGAALGKMGRIPEAIEQLNAALRIDPNYIDAQNILTKLEAVQKRYQLRLSVESEK